MVEWTSEKSLANRVAALRQRGVNFPKTYPPKNIDESPENRRGVTAHIELAEILVDHLDGKRIHVEIDKPSAGDYDVRIDPDPLLLQVKDLAAMDIDMGGQQTNLLASMDFCKERVLAEAALEPKSSFTTIEIFDDDQARGRMNFVDLQPKVDVVIVTVDDDFLKQETLRKAKRVFDKSAKQLKDTGVPGIHVPVLDLRRFPHDELALHDYLKDVLKDRAFPSGVALLTDELPTKPGEIPRKRLLPIPAPKSPRPLDPMVLNPNHAKELARTSRPLTVVMAPHPAGRKIAIKDNQIIIDDVIMGKIPSKDPAAVTSIMGVIAPAGVGPGVDFRYESA